MGYPWERPVIFPKRSLSKLDTKKISGFSSQSCERICGLIVNACIAITETSKEKKTNSHSYFIQNWVRSNMI